MDIHTSIRTTIFSDNDKSHFHNIFIDAFCFIRFCYGNDIKHSAEANFYTQLNDVVGSIGNDTRKYHFQPEYFFFQFYSIPSLIFKLLDKLY